MERSVGERNWEDRTATRISPSVYYTNGYKMQTTNSRGGITIIIFRGHEERSAEERSGKDRIATQISSPAYIYQRIYDADDSHHRTCCAP